MRTILLVVGGWLLLSFGLAAVFMKWEWNYFLDRPPVFQAVSQVKRVDAVGYFDHGWFSDINGLKASLKSKLGGEELYDDPYYYLNVRPLMAARDAGIDAIAAPEMSAKQVDAVVGEFLHRGLTVNSSHGYDSDRQLHGLVMSFVSRDGRPLTLLAARGGQVSNDHYPYYEALFDDKMDLVQSHMFYFDVAGIEGAEGWPILFLSTIVAGILTAFASLIHMLISVPLLRSLSLRKSARR